MLLNHLRFLKLIYEMPADDLLWFLMSQTGKESSKNISAKSTIIIPASRNAREIEYLYKSHWLVKPFEVNGPAFCLMGWTFTAHAGNGPALMKTY